MGRGGKGKGKGKGGGKRKRGNVWDDYDPVREEAQANTRAEELRNGGRQKRTSMTGQWQQKKVAFVKKKKNFQGQVVDKKAEQYEQLLAQKKRMAKAVYGEEDDDSDAGMAGSDIADDSDADDGSDVSDDELPVAKKKKKSVFDEFVQTFRPASTIAEEEAEEDDEEGNEEEYEEVLVDSDGNEIAEEEEDKDSGDEGGEQEAEDTTSPDEPDAEEDVVEDDDEEVNEDEEEEDASSALDEDPYRQRYVLNTFEEKDAKAFDSEPRKFSAPEDPAAHNAPADLQVTFKPGVASHAQPVPLSKKLYVRQRLMDTWKSKGLEPGSQFSRSSWEYGLFHHMSAYHDVLFAGQTYENTETLRRLSAMHVLNHVIKARDTITRNNERLRKRRDAATKKAEDDKAASSMQDDDEEKEYRDQGFCRASVLVLLPLRSSALAFVKLLLELLPANVDTIHNKDRFFNEYGSAADDEDEEEDKEQESEGDKKEWQKVFSEGNNDDCFQIGLSLSRKALRFYSEYHHADIILASPLALRQHLGDEVVDLDDQAMISSDVLSSIEVCVVDSGSLMLMQNVDHLRNVIKATNLQPKEAPHADFARVREWNLAFLAAYFRQTIVFAHGVEPALNHLVTKSCRNQYGLVRYVRQYDASDGTASISHVVPQLQQIFQRIDVGVKTLTAQQAVDLRFEYFEKHVFTPLLDHPKKHVLIFVPSYFDYVRIRNLFNERMNKKLIRAVQCCEYTTNKQVSRARTSFFHGRCHVMLYTERFHFYHQYQIRGAHQVIWYGLPMMGDFYPEMLNNLVGTNTGADAADDEHVTKSSIALFTRLDLFRLQRIVGQKRAERMCAPKATKSTFLFC